MIFYYIIPDYSEFVYIALIFQLLHKNHLLTFTVLSEKENILEAIHNSIINVNICRIILII